MKSRWTTYALLVAALAVWGLIGWKALTPRSQRAIPAPPACRPAAPPPSADTLMVDYPDPFLKGLPAATEAAPSVVRPLPREATAASRHKGSIDARLLAMLASGGRKYYVLSLGGETFEAERGETVQGLRVEGDDGDSLYLSREGVRYAVKLCE